MVARATSSALDRDCTRATVRHLRGQRVREWVKSFGGKLRRFLRDGTLVADDLPIWMAADEEKWWELPPRAEWPVPPA